MAKKEKFSQELLEELLNGFNDMNYCYSKYNDDSYIETNPHGLEILRFISPGYRDLVKSPHFLCRCSCGRLTLKKCNHVVDGTVKSCGLCSSSKYNDTNWVGLEINNYKVVDTVRHDDQMYFKVECMNCNSISEVSSSGLVSGVFKHCENCYRTPNYEDKTAVEITTKHKYIKQTDEYIVKELKIGNTDYYITQCAKCELQRLRVKQDIENLNFGKFIKCICKRVRLDRPKMISKSDIERKKRMKRVEYYRAYSDMVGTKQGKILIKEFILRDRIKDSSFICDCDCGRKDVEMSAYSIFNGRTTQCGKCLVAPNEKYSNTDYIGQVFRYLKVTGIIKENHKTYFKCTCLNCNTECIFPAHAVVYGNNSSCGCMTSVYEQLVADTLTEAGVKFKRQATFDGLLGIGGGKLRFDFMCESKDGRLVAIEYDGQQHFKPVKFSELNSEEKALEDFEKIVYHDELKNNFCVENNIEMYRLNGNISTQDVLDIIELEQL